MWVKLKHFFRYYTIKEGLSRVSGPYKVVMWLNRPRLIIGNMIQSGDVIRRIWNKGIADLKGKHYRVKNALVLGCGCGDTALAIKKFYRKAKITGVEIDAEIIEIAKCYFDLATIKDLNIAIDDGAKYVAKLARLKRKPAFDLIVIDAYLGSQMPKAFRSQSFFKQLTRLLTHNGVVIYNHLFYDQYKAEAEKFIKEMETEFGKITLVRAGQNLLIFGWY